MRSFIIILICIALTGAVLYLAGLWDLRNRLVHEQSQSRARFFSATWYDADFHRHIFSRREYSHFSKEHGVLRRVHSSVRYHVPGSDVHLLGFAGYMAKPGEQEAK